ncbi:type II secretion system secretin GspD [Nitrincola alkalilacustris]|uniref:type II secretion system secretin GspD n=1 Tax=Nitrincola alkalilacustris TaxID=1571224 RepID=UPI00124CC9A6|nr:type II secretion system secretin GspD [Nitrincola alkalilacustris]
MMALTRKLPVLGFFALVLSGCSSGHLSKPAGSGPVLPYDLDSRGEYVQRGALSDAQTEELIKSDPIIYRGNDRVANTPAARNPIALHGDAVSLNFEQAPVTEVVHAVLGDILELDYVIEHPLDGEITLRTRTPVPRDQLLVILESLLQTNGAVMIRDKNDRFFVGSAGSMSGLMPGVTSAGSTAAGYSNVVIPLQYIGAREMADILRPVADEGSFVRVDATRNLLLLAGTRNQIDGWMEIIATFDIDLLQGMSVGIFPLEYASVSEVDSAIQVLLGGSDAQSDTTSSIAAATLSSVVRIIPIERLNSILVVSPRAHYLDQVGVWIERLDKAPDHNFESQLFVYPVQNGSATHLAKLLSELFGVGGGMSSQRDSGVSPAMTATRQGGESGSEVEGVASATGAGNRSSDLSSNFSLAGDIKVVADGQSNALLIYAKRSEYKKIESAMKKLDIAPTQVLIEASIIEISLRDRLEYGLQWHIQNGLGGGRTGTSVLNVTDNPIGPAQGFSFSVTNPLGDIRAVINALAEESLVNVISSPSVMVLDNHTATMQVGDQQPIRSSQTVTDGGNITSSIQYRDTGVKLMVTPSVNAGGMVNMDIEQSVTDVGPEDSATGQRSFQERNISSRVAIRSGETVVLGGLIRDNTSDVRAGVPILHELPVVGNLFGATTNRRDRTELIVMITPRVLTNEQDLRDVSREIRSRMSGLNLLRVESVVQDGARISDSE